MSLMQTTITTIPIRPRYLWFLMICYTMALFASNWFDPRQIEIFGLCTGAGSIIFPLTYLLSDVITEVYGYKNARVAIWSALLFYSMLVLYGQFIIHFLDAGAHTKAALALFSNVNSRIIFATYASYLATESINSYVVAKLKISFCGKYVGLRFILATLAAYIVNELTYAPIAFYGSLIVNTKDFIFHMIGSWIFMVAIELLLLPFFVRMAKKIKVVEQSDIYDEQTDFNIFSLNSRYTKENNKFTI